MGGLHLFLEQSRKKPGEECKTSSGRTEGEAPDNEAELAAEKKLLGKEDAEKGKGLLPEEGVTGKPRKKGFLLVRAGKKGNRPSREYFFICPMGEGEKRKKGGKKAAY